MRGKRPGCFQESLLVFVQLGGDALKSAFMLPQRLLEFLNTPFLLHIFVA
ncbi:hypothetical protein AA0312_1337 [Acetobacter tropicalis NRIC 0312]|uniref:Uncharacterized protein n=1 Tax=Acetobacter tropicalis TaxID=104102 RepID=A0A511FKB3_9PROT|nr:hypothetical protein ATR1_042d0076 [Acetobacter tropicalis]GBR69315.1 hypothetical protein AA0312_1337 [Acetobacter tropicalis NRIC 0312]GEL49666.1 hypothetical protein ATR01nite_07410 [Acetobacter tropicalis]